jgi:biotin-dependent carboxylase-like uncharacterized protein
MSPGLRVIAPGLHSTIQDLGRRGYQNIGVPLSGALDRIGLTLANALVGNAANAPALELLVQGPLLEVAAASVRIAVAGAEGGLVIEGEPGRRVPAGQSARLTRGQTIRIAAFGNSFCAYLAVEGGFDVAPCLGSSATYTRNRLGGFQGRALGAGDILPVCRNEADVRLELALGQPYDPGLDRPIRVVLGPQQDYFTADAVNTFLSAAYRVSAQADRMGFRLDGPKLAHAKGYEVISDGIVAGAVQVPGSGQPIVMLADAQTTGGYAKIATVISADVPVLARRPPGAPVRFAAVTQAEAEHIRREQENDLRNRISRLQTMPEVAALDAAALEASNLIDGVISALD